MAVKYNPYSPGTRPLFFRLPGGRGGTQSGLALPAPSSRPPPAVLNGPGQSHQLNVRDRGTPEEILRIAIKNPTNRPISKQSVIYLVRIISIERTWTISRPFEAKILRSPSGSQELFSLHGLMFASANRRIETSRAHVNYTGIV